MMTWITAAANNPKAPKPIKAKPATAVPKPLKLLAFTNVKTLSPKSVTTKSATRIKLTIKTLASTRVF